MTHEGGSNQVQVSGMGSLTTFPHCSDGNDLGDWLGHWNECRLKYGAHIPDEHLVVMLLEKLPKQISKEVRENKTLATVDGIIAHLESEIVRLNDTKIANLHSQRLKHMLGKKSVNSVIAHHES